jgi:hypothetical protein
MLAPPNRRRKRQKPVADRRAADRKRKAKERARAKNGMHRVELWITGRAYEGMIAQFVATGKLSDEAAFYHRNFEHAFERLIEVQGGHWSIESNITKGPRIFPAR